MRTTRILRPVLDGAAVVLFALALAYHWLGNAAHEVIGTALIVLVAVHNAFNRRWWGALPRLLTRPDPTLRALVNASVLVAMLILGATSLMVSRAVFGFLGIESGLTARDWHIAAAWWALAAVSVHIGTHLPRLTKLVLRDARHTLGVRFVLWTIALVLAVWGVDSVSELGLLDKLRMDFGFDLWDFRNRSLEFLARIAAVIVLFALPAHLLMNRLLGRIRPVRRPVSRATASHRPEA